MSFFKTLWQTDDGHLVAPATKTLKGLPASAANGEAVRHEQLVVAANRVLGSVAGGPASGIQVSPAMLAPVLIDRSITGTLTNGDKLTLSTAQTNLGSWANAVSDEQEVPSAGRYRISVRARASSSSASAGAFVGVSLFIGGTTAFALSDVTRFDTTTSTILTIPTLVHIANITDPATQKISVLALGSGTITFAGSTYCRLIIERLA